MTARRSLDPATALDYTARASSDRRSLSHAPPAWGVLIIVAAVLSSVANLMLAGTKGACQCWYAPTIACWLLGVVIIGSDRRPRPRTPDGPGPVPPAPSP